MHRSRTFRAVGVVCTLSCLILVLAFAAGVVDAEEAPAPPAAELAPTAAPAPVTGVAVKDNPSDGGKKVIVTWTPSADDGAGAMSVRGYVILRAKSAEGPFEATGLKAALGEAKAIDQVPDNGVDYWYKVRAVTAAAEAGGAPAFGTDSDAAGPARASIQLFKWGLLSVAVLTAGFCLAVLYVLILAGRGKQFWIRPISGINAIDEAIGRATEMGKPILFVPGLFEANDPPTLAAFSILNRVAKKVAAYQCRLIVPCYYAMVMVVAREVVKNAYSEAGRPDAYVERDVFYLTQEQFAYVAGINGMMLREKPATNFYLGAFFAESLMLAETGFQAGSIQIAGTDQPIQIPFFVAACDYTMIGEELYAAAAYLSDDPRQKATLKAQDYGKAAVLTLLGAGVALWFVGPFLTRILPDWLPTTAVQLAAWLTSGAS